MAEAERTVEDRLREEYFTLLPEIRRVADRLEAEIRYHALPISGALHGYERLVVKCRVKSCESALNKLRRHQETRAFQEDRPEAYTLTSLNDLAGVRVLALLSEREVGAVGAAGGVFTRGLKAAEECGCAISVPGADGFH